MLTFQKQTDLSSAVSGFSYVSPVDTDRELKTSADLLTGPSLKASATAVLASKGQLAGPAYKISAEAVADTNALNITATSTGAQRAADVANAYAEAFVARKLQALQEQLASAEGIIQQRLKRYTTASSRNDPGYYQLASRLQDLRVMQAMATGNYRIADPATPATAPYTPKLVRDLLLGLIIGILGGIAAAFLAEQLDVRVRSQEEIAHATRLPIIGRLPRPSKDDARETGLAVLRDPEGHASEAFRILRGNLDYVAVDTELRSILVTSASQSEGKTTTACNLAVTLARSGKRVAVLEADLRRPMVHQLFGLPNKVGLTSVVAGRVTLSEALQPIELGEVDEGADTSGAVTASPGVLVLTSGPLPPNPNEIVASSRMTALIKDLAALCDVVVVDAPPFLAVGDAGALAAKTDGILMVVRLGRVTRAMLRDLSDFLRPLPCRRLGIVVTNIQLEGASYRYEYRRDHSGSKKAAPAGDAGA